MAERKQQNRDLTEMEVIDSGSKESAAQTVHRMRRNEAKEMIRVLKTADDTIEIDATSTVGMDAAPTLSFDGLLERR